MKKGDLVRACDYLTRAERSSIPACMPYQTNVMIEYTGEFRPPKRGEWYISGAIPEGYRARADLNTPYHIGRPAVVETKTETRVVQRVVNDEGWRMVMQPEVQDPSRRGGGDMTPDEMNQWLDHLSGCLDMLTIGLRHDPSWMRPQRLNGRERLREYEEAKAIIAKLRPGAEDTV